MTSIYFKEGKKFLNEKKYERALDCFKKAVAEEPKNPQYYLHKAFSLEGLQKFNDALEDLKKAHQLDPEAVNIIMCLAGIYLEVFNNPQEALIYLDQVIDKRPPFISDAYVFKGMALKRLGLDREAKEAFSNVLELKIMDDDYRGHFHKARALVLLDQERKAIQSLKKAIRGKRLHYTLEDALENELLKKIAAKIKQVEKVVIEEVNIIDEHFKDRLKLLLNRDLKFLEQLKLVPHFFFEAKIGDKMVGTIHLLFAKERGWLVDGFFVDDKLRNLGIGKKLIGACIVKAKEKNVKEIWSSIADDRDASQKCHMALNFVKRDKHLDKNIPRPSHWYRLDIKNY